MNNNDQEIDALAFHRAHRGKIEVRSIVPLSDRGALSLAYTPGVAEVALAIAENPASVYDYTLKGRTVAIISDGTAVLGLGDLGPEAAIPIMEGKAAIFKEFAGIDAFPICLDTRDVDEIVETVVRIAPVFGAINLEDISAPRCFEIEKKIRARLDIPVVHDDQHGTAIVVLAALINAFSLTGRKFGNAKIVVNGSGAAGHAIAEILHSYGAEDVIVCDSKGIISPSRTNQSSHKRALAEKINKGSREGDLESALFGADVFVGVSKGNILSDNHIRMMAKNPIIFALANPIPEIMPERALEAGAAIVATGRSDFPNQINNALAYPGLFKGLLAKRDLKIDSELYIRAAEALAKHKKDPAMDALLPELFDKTLPDAIASAL